LAEKSGAPVGVIVGEEEITTGTVRIKQLGLGEHSNGEQIERTKMAESIIELLKNSE
jgi:histidyl-tRNA synthetase